MEDAAEYLAHVKSLLISAPQITNLNVVREEAQGRIGLYRYRLSLVDNSMLEAFERFEVTATDINVTKYSFQWQYASGALRRRWDNAPHHPQVTTHPHHVHDGSDDTVLPHPPVTIVDILEMLD